MRKNTMWQDLRVLLMFWFLRRALGVAPMETTEGVVMVHSLMLGVTRLREMRVL